MQNNEDATAAATARGSVPSSSSQRGAEECTNKSIRNDNGEVDANDNASEAASPEIIGDSQGCQLPQGERGTQVAEERRPKRATTTTTIVSAETGSDLRWIYCRERGCTFWTRKPGTIHSTYDFERLVEVSFFGLRWKSSVQSSNSNFYWQEASSLQIIG